MVDWTFSEEGDSHVPIDQMVYGAIFFTRSVPSAFSRDYVDELIAYPAD